MQRSSNLVHTLASLSDHYFKHFEDKALDALRFCLSKLTTDSLGVQEPKAAMEYYSIYETNHFHMNIIVLKKGRTIPLHDHPGMTVLSTLIKGALKIQTYQWLNTLDSQQSMSNLAAIISHQTINSKSSESLMTISRNSGPSMHSFECVSDYAVIVDILGPPYGEDRICRSYKIIQGPKKQSDGKVVVELEEFQDENEDVVEYVFNGEKVLPELFRKTAEEVLLLLKGTDQKLDTNYKGILG